MQKWEYMWILSTHEKGRNVFVANGERLEVQTYRDALNAAGKEGWELVNVLITGPFSHAAEALPQFCLKRPLSA